jgi:hypothetical protein
LKGGVSNASVSLFYAIPVDPDSIFNNLTYEALWAVQVEVTALERGERTLL